MQMQKLNKKLIKGEIPIFFSCDDKYIPFLATALTSIIQNASKNYNYKIKVLHAGTICSLNQNKIIQKFGNNNFDVEFVNIANYVEKLNAKLHTRDYYSKSTYYRLFIPSLYPNYNKALYLDSDIVVLGDISKLYKTELGWNLVGAVSDESVGLIKQFQEYVVNRIGVKNHKHYFNAGILLMNLKRLREINFENMFIKLLSKVTFNVAQDQDYLNAICRDRVTYISKAWNKMPFENKRFKPKNINLIHYNLDKKPWQTDNILYEEYFWKYASLSGFYDDIVKIKCSYTKQQQQKSAEQTALLIKRTHEQATDKFENARINRAIKQICFGNNFNLENIFSTVLTFAPQYAKEKL